MSLSDGFFLFYSWADLLDTLDGEDYKALLTAIIARQRFGTSFPNFSNKLLNTYAAMIEPIIQQRLYGQMGGYKVHAYPTIPPTIPPTIEPTGVKLSNVEYSNINNTTTIPSLSLPAHTREGSKNIPSFTQIVACFDELGVENSTQQAELFEAYNESRDWDCLPKWQAAAKRWKVRIAE